MDSECESSNEVAISEGRADIPALQEMINDIRESAASFAQTSNTSLAADDLLIKKAIAVPIVSENEEIGHSSTNKISESLVGGIISTGKLVSLVLNNAADSDTPESEESFSDTTSIGQIHPQMLDKGICPAPPLAQATAIIDTPKKKQHIMISYNRSCEESCRNIRNKLKELKYKVWMDVYDMHDNFIEGMAKAIRNSYIVLLCLNRNYDESYWCRKEIEGAAIKGIKFIPCFMEKPFDLVDWLDFLVGGNLWIDFSKVDKFDDSFNKLIDEITSIEEKLATKPRETPTTTPTLNPLITITCNHTIEESFDLILRNFKNWVEEHRHDLQRFDRKQSSQLINQLIQGLQSDDKTFDDKTKTELLQTLLSSTCRDQNQLVRNLFNNFNASNSLLLKSSFFVMALWAVRVVFKK